MHVTKEQRRELWAMDLLIMAVPKVRAFQNGGLSVHDVVQRG
jgi:hypothetical protein